MSKRLETDGGRAVIDLAVCRHASDAQGFGGNIGAQRAAGIESVVACRDAAQAQVNLDASAGVFAGKGSAQRHLVDVCGNQPEQRMTAQGGDSGAVIHFVVDRGASRAQGGLVHRQGAVDVVDRIAELPTCRGKSAQFQAVVASIDRTDASAAQHQ